MAKVLGKIKNVKLGKGGYQDAMFGVEFTFESKPYTYVDFEGFWLGEPGPHSQWTKADQENCWIKIMTMIQEAMKDANVKNFESLRTAPVELTVYDGKLKSWRILTEVL